MPVRLNPTPFLCLLQHADEDLLLHLVDEGGLLSRLKGVLYWEGSEHGPDIIIDKLTMVWTKKCEALSDRVNAAIAGGYGSAPGSAALRI